MRNENNCRRVVSLKLNFLLFLFCGEGAIFLNLVRVEFESDDEIRPALCCEIGGLILFDFDAVALITRGRACVCLVRSGAIPPSGRHGSARNRTSRGRLCWGERHVAMKRNRKVAIKWIMQRVVSVSGTLVCPRQRVEIGATVGGDSLGVTHPETQKVYSPPSCPV